jgi:hypothetical protein
MEPEINQRFAALEKEVSALQISLAKKSGAQQATAWWAGGTALLIAAWLGASSLWHIPRVVRDELQRTAAGEAATAAITNIDKLRAAYEARTTFRLLEPQSGSEVGLSADEIAVPHGSGHGLVRLPPNQKGTTFVIRPN